MSTLSGDYQLSSEEAWKYVVQKVSSTIVEHRNSSGTVVEQLGLKLREKRFQGFNFIIIKLSIARRLSETSPQRHNVTKVTKVTLFFYCLFPLEND
ncbi:hypothetical protein PSENEW3_00000281 [Picochlorum sp. SENEW3]|nr:hypothetical protein PSENEW3_00000281 [Picochlorum sp. SENEW3]